MGTVLIDTNVLSFEINNRPEAEGYRALIGPRSVVLSFVTVAELHFGALRRNWGARRLRALEARLSLTPVVAGDADVAVEFARAKATLEALGTPVDGSDLWIASCALVYGVPVVTHNPRHLRRVPGLVVESVLP